MTRLYASSDSSYRSASNASRAYLAPHVGHVGVFVRDRLQPVERLRRVPPGGKACGVAVAREHCRFILRIRGVNRRIAADASDVADRVEAFAILRGDRSLMRQRARLQPIERRPESGERGCAPRIVDDVGRLLRVALEVVELLARRANVVIAAVGGGERALASRSDSGRTATRRTRRGLRPRCPVPSRNGLSVAPRKPPGSGAFARSSSVGTMSTCCTEIHDAAPGAFAGGLLHDERHPEGFVRPRTGRAPPRRARPGPRRDRPSAQIVDR